MMKTALLLFALGSVPVSVDARDRMLRNKSSHNKKRFQKKAVQAEDVEFWMRDLQMGR